MARTKKKVTKEVTPIEEIVEATTEEVEPDKVSEVMDHEIKETKKGEEEEKAKKKSTKKVKEPQNEVHPTGVVEIFYTPGIADVDCYNVQKALLKKGTDFILINMNEYPMMKEAKGIKGHFAVAIPLGEEEAMVTQYKTALKVLRENGKI